MELLNRPRKVAIGVGAALGVTALAFAATSIVSSIGGTTEVVGGTSPGAAESFKVVSVTGTGYSGSGAEKCQGAASGRDITLKVSLNRGSSGSVYGQGCQFAIRVENPRPANVTGVKLDIPATQDGLGNWAVSTQGPDAVLSGRTADYIVSLSPKTENPAAGSFTGTLTGGAQ